MEVKTGITPVKRDGIPAELRELKQFVCWQGKRAPETEKLNKVPKKYDGRAGSSTNPATWSTLDKALDAVEADDRLDGIGLAGLELTPYIGIDLDHCRDPETGELSPYARKWIEAFNSYSEVTVSGTGVRVWIKATKEPGSPCAEKTDPKREREAYDRGRFFTVTGQRLDGTPGEIKERQDIFDRFMAEELPKPAPKNEPREYTGDPDHRIELDDLLNEVEVLARINDSQSETAYKIVCPWVGEHTGGDKSGTRVGQYPSGALWFKCDHAHCAVRDWFAFRERVEPRITRTGKVSSSAARATADQPTEATNTPTHDELADEFIGEHPEYCYGLEAWRKAEAGRYIEVADREVRREIKRVCVEAKSRGIRPTDSLIKSVTSMAADARYVPDREWNIDDETLSFHNGILDIPTRELQPHRLDNYVTTALAYDYDPAAECPRFEDFIGSRVGKVGFFIQEFAGYCLTRETDLETAIWLYGPPGSGRSTLIMALEAMLGDLAGTLGVKDLDRNPFALANLIGKTLVTATELPTGRMQGADSILNGIISGDKVSVNEKHKPQYNIYPGAKVLWAMNGLPRVPDPNNGLFRRVKVVKFPPLDPAEKDPNLKTILKAEAPGILNWALSGLERLRERCRFNEPQSVIEATREFKETNDVPALFLADKCERDPNGSVSAELLYLKFSDWADERGYGRGKLPENRMKPEWERLGLEWKRTNKGVIYKGVTFRKQDIGCV